MKSFYQYITLCITLFGAIFFPYMPIVHANPVESGTHRGCSGLHAGKGTEQHSMLLCIRAIHDTSIGHIVIELGGEVYTLIPIWKQEIWNDGKISQENIHLFHVLDPPTFEGKDLVGIIKLTT